MSRHRHGPSRPRPSRARVVVETLLLSLLVAFPAGAAWYSLAPEVRLRVGSDGDARLTSGVAVGVFGFDGWFVVVGTACGLLLGALLVLRHRHEPVAVVAALVAGGMLGSVLAWRVGLLLGPGPADQRAAGLGEGATVVLEPGIEAYGVLFAWPVAAMVAVLAVSALLDDRTPLTPRRPPSPAPSGSGPIAAPAAAPPAEPTQTDSRPT